ncbi:MAG: putative lipid II flippase FtsW [Bacilli bacterium]|nr:putative lipid II flippase FtsW [Bacilli bacterium]
MHKPDYILLISIITISLFGVLMIYSSSYVWALYKFNNPLKFALTQWIFLLIGYLIIYILLSIPYTYYLKHANSIFIICLILLVLVLIPGIGSVRNGSRSWFGVGGFGIQPSEFSKLGLIIFTSKYLANSEKQLNNISGILPILVILMIIFGLIMLQPDFGTGVIIVITIIGLLFISGVNMSFFIKLGLLGLVGVVGLIVVAPYRIKRIVSFLNPWTDPLGSGFQIIQSLYAIGPSGLLGSGFGNSIQKHFYLPEPQTDFIFSIISEEFGFVGVLIVSILFFVIIYRGFRISKNCENKFGKYLSFGITFGLAFQAILNLMVVVGLIPVTGVTLPFLSYGGSSLLITMLSMGILLNISKYNYD